MSAGIRSQDTNYSKNHKFNQGEVDRQGRDFSGYTLHGAKFEDLSLENANFSGAFIQGANFSGSKLNNADFSEAKAGLLKKVPPFVAIATLASIVVSAFTASVAMTFCFQFFFANFNERCPNLREDKDRLSLEESWAIGIISFVALASIRILINNNLGSAYIPLHMACGIITIIIILIIGTKQSKVDKTSFCAIALVAFLPLILLFFLNPQVKEIDKIIENSGQFSWIKGLGTGDGKTNGAITSGFIGSLTGTVIGCFFSRLSICKSEKFEWLNFDWMWRCYLKFVSADGNGTNFYNADLAGANFKSAILKGASFEFGEAAVKKMSNINWYDAKYLNYAIFPENSYLRYPKIRYLLVTRGYSNTFKFDGLDLNGINLKEIEPNTSTDRANFVGTNLKNASFVGTNLNNANLRGAILTNTNLTRASLDGADLTNATLTGALIKSWSIDEKTKLNGVKCDYVIIKEKANERGHKVYQCRPNTGEFKDGEFEAIFREDASILELLIRYTDKTEGLTNAFKDLIARNNGYVLQGLDLMENLAVVRIRLPNPSDRRTVLEEFSQIVDRGNKESSQEITDAGSVIIILGGLGILNLNTNIEGNQSTN